MRSWPMHRSRYNKSGTPPQTLSVYNLTRVMNIVGIKPLLAAIRA
jgi:hypothetical protein